MSPFAFTSIQALKLSKEDKPNISMRDGSLVLTAERDGSSIVITAPLPGTIPNLVKTTVKTERKLARTNSYVKPGEQHPLAKLTEKDVKEIRAMAADPEFMKKYTSRHQFLLDLGRAYKVHFTTIAHIIARVTWKHVD